LTVRLGLGPFGRPFADLSALAYVLGRRLRLDAPTNRFSVRQPPNDRPRTIRARFRQPDSSAKSRRHRVLHRPPTSAETRGASAATGRASLTAGALAARTMTPPPNRRSPTAL